MPKKMYPKFMQNVSCIKSGYNTEVVSDMNQIKVRKNKNTVSPLVAQKANNELCFTSDQACAKYRIPRVPCSTNLCMQRCPGLGNKCNKTALNREACP